MTEKNNRRFFKFGYITLSFLSLLIVCLSAFNIPAEDESFILAEGNPEEEKLGLMGNRFLTFSSVVRVNQIETSRNEVHGVDESTVHSPREARILRETIERAWPGARMTWAFSWQALHDNRQNYRDLRELIVSYHHLHGDEITFIPGAYFSPMYNSREQTNKDLHEGLKKVSDMVGGGYRPLAVIGGFMAADNLKYLAEKEGIHVCQGTIWSQYAVDNGDGDGSIVYPYYPSKEHYCKPAQSEYDKIDCVNLDGWTVDFLNARFSGARKIEGINCGSRMGVGPIETVIRLGTEQGVRQMLATTASHFDKGFDLNGFAWVTTIWELSLVEARKLFPFYQGRNGIEGLEIWLNEIRRRWPDTQMITHGEFGMLWRNHYKNNDDLDYQFVHRGSGICGSEPELEIRWFMNKDFRMATLRNWIDQSQEKVIDFTRYDLEAKEPESPKPGNPIRNWSLMNSLNQKGSRPQDIPTAIDDLQPDEKKMIEKRYPVLFDEGHPLRIR